MSKETQELIAAIGVMPDEAELWAMNAGVADYHLASFIVLKALVAERNALMLLVKDFLEESAECSPELYFNSPCTVHDWHNGAECPYRRARQAIEASGGGDVK